MASFWNCTMNLTHLLVQTPRVLRKAEAKALQPTCLFYRSLLYNLRKKNFGWRFKSWMFLFDWIQRITGCRKLSGLFSRMVFNPETNEAPVNGENISNLAKMSLPSFEFGRIPARFDFLSPLVPKLDFTSRAISLQKLP